MQADDADDEPCGDVDDDRQRARDDRAAAMEAARAFPLPRPGCGAVATADTLQSQACVTPASDGWLADAASTLLDVLIA